MGTRCRPAQNHLVTIADQIVDLEAQIGERRPQPQHRSLEFLRTVQLLVSDAMNVITGNHLIRHGKTSVAAQLRHEATHNRLVLRHHRYPSAVIDVLA
jgi:predicted house-cleaning NTP pyrophosphatase (Maf/HAM1 superfamily)